MKVQNKQNLQVFGKSQAKEERQQVATPAISKEKFQLPGYNQVNRNLKSYTKNKPNFGMNFLSNIKKIAGETAGEVAKAAAKSSDGKLSPHNEKLLKDIEVLMSEKRALSSDTASDEIKAAKDRISKVNSWNDSTERSYAERRAHEVGTEAKNNYTRGHGGMWKFFNGDGTSEYDSAHSSKMEDLYYAPKRKIDKYKENIHADKQIVALSDQNETQKKKRLEEIDKQIALIKKLISYQGLQDTVNDMLSAKGGIKDRLAGYHHVKKELTTKFVDKLAKSKSDPTTDVPSCVILYGPTGTGKTTFLNAIAEQSKEHAEVIDISSLQSSKGFMDTVNRLLDEAKTRYASEGRRTILLMNEAQQVLSINKTDAPLMGIKLDDQDINMLEDFGNNSKKVNDFKSLLDDSSKIPDGNDTNSKSATTFFITTNYPHLIHPDILSREGKATKIAVGLAENQDLADVLRFQFERMNKVADTIKAFRHNANYKEAIGGIAGISEQGREHIIKMVANGTIDRLKVDHENMPYGKIAQALNPDKNEGAYSNDRLRVIAQDAFMDYLESDPSKSDYKDSFFKVLINTRRDINPARLAKFTTIERMLKDKKISPDDLEQLLKQKKMGMLTEKTANLLDYHTRTIHSELESLNRQAETETLSAEKLQKKAELEELKQKIEDSEKPEKVTKESDDPDFE